MGLKDFFHREVVNAGTAERLGYISDFEIDVEKGIIRSVIVPKRKGFLSFFSSSEYIIPWENILTMGDEIILVKLEEEKEIKKEKVSFLEE